MELVTIPSAISAGMSLVPVAMKVYSCYQMRCRKIKSIRKHVIVLPPRSGKGFLAAVLKKQRQYWVVDVDEEIKKLKSPSTIARMTKAKAEGDYFAYETAYLDLCSTLRDDVRSQCKKNTKLRVVFLTSSWAFANLFKKDAVCVVAPDSEFFDSILDSTEESDKEYVRKGRQDFISNVPPGCIQTYPSLVRLEELVRARLEIVATL